MSCFFRAFLLLAAVLLCRSATLLAQQAKVEPVASTTSAESTAESSTESSTESSAGQSAQGEPVAPAAPPRFTLPAEQHPWGRFPPGAWREIQITTETFNPKGKVINRSVTTQKEVLKAQTDETYAIDVQATVDLVGKRIVGDWKTRVLKLATDGAGEISDTRQKENVSLPYDGAPVECQVWELRYRDDARQMVDRIYYQPERFPFIMQRETSEQASDGSAKPAEQTVQVTVPTIPYFVQGEMTLCSCLRSLRQRPKGNSSRVVFLAPSVPGGEVAAWSSDFDSHGQLTRWSTLELLDFGLESSE
ncbi:MAG: hypothetical protein MI725_06650 [Pirellulales bacterium]|nr:hypothetical protein [Pirellulales bacterium]